MCGIIIYEHESLCCKCVILHIVTKELLSIPGLFVASSRPPPVPWLHNSPALLQDGLRRLQDYLQLRLLLRVYHRHAVYPYDAGVVSM